MILFPKNVRGPFKVCLKTKVIYENGIVWVFRREYKLEIVCCCRWAMHSEQDRFDKGQIQMHKIRKESSKARNLWFKNKMNARDGMCFS